MVRFLVLKNDVRETANHASAVAKCEVPEAGFLKGQTKLEWHLGQVGPKKFECLVIIKIFLRILLPFFMKGLVPILQNGTANI